MLGAGVGALETPHALAGASGRLRRYCVIPEADTEGFAPWSSPSARMVLQRARGSGALGHAAQAQADPEFQALLARQVGEDGGGGAEADGAGLTVQQKDAGLASVFKRDDDNLARRCPAWM